VATNFFGVLQSFQGDVSLQATIASLIVSSGCIAFSDVVADGIVVQKTREADLAGQASVAGGLQSLCWGSASLGALISAYFSGSLLETFSPQQVFGFTAFLPLIVAIFAFGIEEEKLIGPLSSQDRTSNDLNNNISYSVDFGPDQNTFSTAIPSQNELKIIDNNDKTTLTLKEQIETLWRAIQMPSVWKPALFLFLWQSTPTSDGAFLYFMTNDLGLGPEFLGRVRLATAVASFVGVWGYQKFLRQVSIKNILLWSSIASAPLGLIQLLLITHVNRDLGIPDGAFVFGDDVVLAVLGEFAFLPTLVLAAKICPPGIEAVLFATLMSIFNGASTVGTEVGAILTKSLGVTESDFSNLWLLNVICNVSSLYPLVFIGLLDGIGSQSVSELEDDETVVTT
jgi:folate/biopterin transporter